MNLVRTAHDDGLRFVSGVDLFYGPRRQGLPNAFVPDDSDSAVLGQQRCGGLGRGDQVLGPTSDPDVGQGLHVARYQRPGVVGQEDDPLTGPTQSLDGLGRSG